MEEVEGEGQFNWGLGIADKKAETTVVWPYHQETVLPVRSILPFLNNLTELIDSIIHHEQSYFTICKSNWYQIIGIWSEHRHDFKINLEVKMRTFHYTNVLMTKL